MCLSVPAYASLIRSVMDHIDPMLPTVFIAHIYVAGITTPNNHELTYDNDIRLGRARICQLLRISSILL